MDNSQRAHQLWSVLVFAAHNRQILTYAFLGKLVGLPAAAIGRSLYPIQYFCKQQGLPPLTVLVVNQATGRPGEGLDVDDFAKMVQEVFEFDWISYKAPGSEVGPNSEDLKQASENNEKNK
jgi:hypothetical protein